MRSQLSSYFVTLVASKPVARSKSNLAILAIHSMDIRTDEAIPDNMPWLISGVSPGSAFALALALALAFALALPLATGDPLGIDFAVFRFPPNDSVMPSEDRNVGF